MPEREPNGLPEQEEAALEAELDVAWILKSPEEQDAALERLLAAVLGWEEEDAQGS